MLMKQDSSNCSSFGKLIILIGILLAIPLVVLYFYPEEVYYASSFILPSLSSIFLGMLLCLFSKNESKKYQRLQTMKNSNLIVLFAWSYGFFVGALPFIISGQLNFTQALFESISGWTTTGLSVMDVEATNHIFLFYRSFMQFSGGLGFVMVMVMFIQGKQSMNLYNAEGHPDKLMPNLKSTSRIILIIYLSFLIVGTILYMIFGMNLFESLIHTMSALSTGGFSSRVDSIGAYDSIAIESITIVLMLIGTTNFAVLMLLINRKFKQVLRVSEVRFMIVLIAAFVPIVTFTLLHWLYISVGESIRVALFNVVSALSTTGYSTMSYSDWPQLAIGIVILLMLIGGGLGSTAGGIKLTRAYLFLRITRENVRKKLTPARNVAVPTYYRPQGKAPIDSEMVLDIMGFISFYFLIYLIGTLTITFTENSTLAEAMFEFASALGTVGLSIGLINPTTGPATLIVTMGGMILGRLEIFAVLIGIYSGASLLNQRLQTNH